MATFNFIKTLAGSELELDVIYNPSGAAKPSSCRMFLTSGITLTNETTMAGAAAVEVNTAGYARQSIQVTSIDQNTANDRAEGAMVTCTFNPTASTTYDGICVALNASATVRNTSGTLIYVRNLASPVTFTGTYEITFAINSLGVTYSTTGYTG
jgi:hypothetical protein